jgi:hypothetical protein
VTSERLRALEARGIEEFRRFLVMFLYLWAAFGLFVLNEAVVLRKTDVSFLAQGFALINAAILAKVMLIAEAMKLGRRFDDLPLIWPIAYKSALFAVLFIVCHGLEEVVVAAVAGKPVAASIPAIGGGTWIGAAFVWAILAVSLLPFFALREIDRLLGKGQLWKLMFHRAATADADGAPSRD